jgi:RND family efflux transporter MFP subunit
VDLARAQAAEAVVYAPFSGVVSARLLSEGALASPTTPVVTLVTDEVEVVVNIEEARVGQVPQGRPAVLTVSAFPGDEFQAVVASVSPTADPRSRTFQAKVVPTNNDGKLKEGMFAQVKIRGDERGNAILIPNQAIVQRSGKSVAFVVADGKAQLRELQVGITDGKQTEVTSGLEPGDQLIVAGQDGAHCRGGLLPQPGAALDVGEEVGDRPGRQARQGQAPERKGPARMTCAHDSTGRARGTRWPRGQAALPGPATQRTRISG